MKKSILLLLVLTLLTGCCMGALAQTANVQGTTAPERIRIGGTGDDAAHDALALSNGNLLVAIASGGGRNGEPRYSQNTRKAWLVCLAPDGTTVWETEFGEKGEYTLLTNLIENPDGTVTGVAKRSIQQHSQASQSYTFAIADGKVVAQGEQMVDTRSQDQISRNTLMREGFTFVVEIHDSDATTEPRILRLSDKTGKELWQVDASDVGIHNVRNWIRIPDGAIIYGTYWDETRSEQMLALLMINDSGKVVWRYTPDTALSGMVKDALLDNQNRLVVVGSLREEQVADKNGQPLGYWNWRRILLCIDTATGSVIWDKREAVEDDVPSGYIVQTEAGYLLCDGNGDYTGIEYELINGQGETLSRFATTMEDVTFIGPRFFTWNGEVWTQTLISEDDQDDVLLERVPVPAQ